MHVKDTIETLLRDGFILVFNQDRLDMVKTAEALLEAGIGNMEVTCRVSRPLEKMAQLRKALPEFAMGAASLIDYPPFLECYNRCRGDDPLPDVRQVVEAGVDYLVSAANFSPETYRAFAGKLPLIPGCGTVSEVLGQYSLGANFCKLFPARQLGGPAFVKAIDPAIHKTISLIPTGGTNDENIPDYIAAGVLVIGGSFSMIDKETMGKIVDEQDYTRLGREFRRIKAFIDRYREQRWSGLRFSEASLDEISRQTGRVFNC